MEKYATNPKLSEVQGCEAHDLKPGIPAMSTDVTCGSCAHYSSLTNTRLALCPFANKNRPEDPK
jgi:hypothetical protein